MSQTQISAASKKTPKPLTIVNEDARLSRPHDKDRSEDQGSNKVDESPTSPLARSSTPVRHPPIVARGIQRTMVGVDYALERRLPAKGQIYAKLGDEVKPETIIAETKVTAGLRVFRLGELLTVSPGKAKKYLHRTIGSRVYQGDVIAEAPKMLGMRSVQFLSPVDGVLQDFNPQTGQLTLQFSPVSFRLPAGVRGKVSQIIPDEGVYIQTKTSLLFGAFMAGKMREGALKIVAPPDVPIQPQNIDAQLAGHIIAGGSLVTKDVINRCLAVGVKGIVSGGIAAHDLLEISGQPNSSEDVGLTMLIVSGLGNMALDDATYQFLQAYQEQHVFLVPQERMLVAPLPSDQEIPTKPATKPVEYLPVKEGDLVRILSSSLVGQVAEVKEIIPDNKSQFSQLHLTSCLLQLPAGDTIKLPLTNIEVVSSQSA